MSKNPMMNGTIYKIGEIEEKMQNIEEKILRYELTDSLVMELGELGFQVNELLQFRITWYDRQMLNNLLKRLNYLRLLYLKTVLELRASKLTTELKELVSDEAWRVFLRLDELRGMEIDILGQNDLHQDYYLSILYAQQELGARLQEIRLKTD